MVSYNYLGYGVTDENGIAKLEYNSEGQKRDHSYTGVGAGEVDVLASLDNPIVDGSIVSKTIEVVDCLFYDICYGTTKNNYWVNQASNLDITYGDASRILTKATGASSGQLTPSTEANATDWTKKKTFNTPICFEYDVFEKGTNIIWRFYDSSNGDLWYQGTHDATGHYKFIIDSTNKVKLEIGGQQQSLSNLPSTLPSVIDFSFTLASVSTGSLSFANFEVYPI